MFICDQQLKDDLEAWASTEGRTVSNLMERIASAAVQDYKNGVMTTSPNPHPQSRHDHLMPKPDFATLQQAIQQNIEQLRHAGIRNLEALSVGEVLPTKADFVKIAATLELDEETQKRLWQQALL